MGVVYRGVYARDSRCYERAGQREAVPGQPFAVKFIELNRGQGYGEADVLTRIDHKHLIKLYNVVTVQRKRLYVFMEFAVYGNLDEYIGRVRSSWTGVRIPERQTQRWCRHMARGLRYLHRNARIAHLDIKCDNVLLQTDGRGGEVLVKLSDFGLSTGLSPTEERMDIIQLSAVYRQLYAVTSFAFVGWSDRDFASLINEMYSSRAYSVDDVVNDDWMRAFIP